MVHVQRVKTIYGIINMCTQTNHFVHEFPTVDIYGLFEKEQPNIHVSKEIMKTFSLCTSFQMVEEESSIQIVSVVCGYHSWIDCF